MKVGDVLCTSDAHPRIAYARAWESCIRCAYDLYCHLYDSYWLPIGNLYAIHDVYTSAIGKKKFSHVTGTGSHDSSAAIADSEKQDGATVIRCS